MASQTSSTDDQRTLPQLRTNKHFRIKSASKDNFIYPHEIMSVRTRHKGSTEQSKRIFSQSRNKKSGSIDTAIKIRIAKEQLERKFQKVKKDSQKRKLIVYDEVRTEACGEPDENRCSARVRTYHQDENYSTLQKMAKVSDPNQIIGHLKLEDTNKESLDSKRFKKNKDDREFKEPKGKYRCRVNQYVFDHSRKKSSFGKKEEQETIDHFWKNVNESMILAGRQEEEVSKDLRQFVENFTTE